MCPLATTQAPPDHKDAVDQPVAQSAEDSPEEEAPPQLTALVIDDTGSHRHAATVLMKRLGFDVEHAENGLQGLQKMTEKTFDVVLCDYEMPEMTGFDCIREFRQWEAAHRPQHQKQPIACFTGTLERDPDIAAEGLEAGMDMVEAKPYSRDKLEKVLEQML